MLKLSNKYNRNNYFSEKIGIIKIDRWKELSFQTFAFQSSISEIETLFDTPISFSEFMLFYFLNMSNQPLEHLKALSLNT